MLLSYICIVLWGVFKALSDLSAENSTKLPPYFRKSLKWTEKWDTDYLGRLQHNTRPAWKYLWVFTPPHQEKFLYSSTWLVSFTDGFHLVELLRALSVVGIILTYEVNIWYLDFVLIYLLRTISFHFCYNHIKYGKL